MKQEIERTRMAGALFLLVVICLTLAGAITVVECGLVIIILQLSYIGALLKELEAMWRKFDELDEVEAPAGYTVSRRIYCLDRDKGDQNE